MGSTRERVYPPLDGVITIPEVLDFHWKHNAELPIFVFSRDGSDELSEISYTEFGRACDRAAYALQPQRSGEERPVVGFIAIADTITYQAITIGMMRAGLIPFPISQRNTPAAVVNLLKKTSCHRLITTGFTLHTLVDGIKAELAANGPEFELSIEEMPSLNDLYPKLAKEKTDDPFESYPQPPTRPPMNDIVMYLHSSGSTGLPKAIPHTHLTLWHWCTGPTTTQYREYRPYIRVSGMALPPFHTLGFYTQMIYGLYAVNSIGVYPPTVTSKESLPVMPTPASILDHTMRTKSNAMVTIPAMLQIWAQSKDSIDLLKKLEVINYSGGALAPRLGNLLVDAGVKLVPVYGGTEFGAPTISMSRIGDTKDWAYMEFGTQAKVRWIPQGDGTYECQFLTNENHVLAVENLSDVRGYATADLWEKHPTRDHLWKLVGRVDDVIIHSSGEKTVPGPMEDIISSSPFVIGAVMFGREHDQPGILIEPQHNYAIDVNDAKQLSELRNKLWPTIDEANKIAPAFSRIFKELILVTSKDKPLPRSAKGTVMKKMALKTYEEEVKSLYATVESSAHGEDVKPPSTWKQADIRDWLLSQAEDINPGKAFLASADLFEQGFDSLSAAILRRRIAGALRSSNECATIKAAESVTQNTVYSYPTIESLSSFLAALVANPQDFTDSKSRKILIEEMIEKYGAGLNGIPQGIPSRISKAAHVVLLTGSTGNLGAQILASILQDDKVRRVYALNRPSGSTSMLERHRERFGDKALDPKLLLLEKLIFVEGDSASPNLGLPENVYNELRDSVSVIIHVAWKVDFNQSLGSFEPNIRGTRNLIDFALSGPNPASTRFLYTSSITSAQSWNPEKGPFPEEVVADASVAIGSGYGEGKYVSERILAKSGLQVTSIRIGQISGGMPNGAWATSEWVPILVKSSVALGVLPCASGVVSWLPMDAVSRAILDIAFAKEQPPIALNLVHPRPVQWNGVMLPVGETVARKLGTHPLPVVSFQQWFSLVEKRATSASDRDLENIPAIKLLETFRAIAEADLVISRKGDTDVETGGFAKFSTAKAQGVSLTMKELQSIGARDAELWVNYWSSVGLFD